MKKKFLMVFMATVLIVACNNENEAASSYRQEDKLSLVAPNGEKIAADESSLYQEASTMVARQFGNDYPFTITDIQYSDIDDGYFAVIEYQLENGMKSNYAVTNNKDVLSDMTVDQLELDLGNGDFEISRNGDEYVLEHKSNTRTSDEGKTAFVCKSASNCKPCQVKMQTITTTIGTATQANGSGKTKVSCSSQCADCKLEATIY